MGDRNERVRGQLVYVELVFNFGVHRVNRTFTVTFTLPPPLPPTHRLSRMPAFFRFFLDA
jgi:hypothetical protein